MDLLPYSLGPLNPRVEHLIVAAVLFGLVHLVISRLLPRINRTLDEREAATKGTERQAEAVREQAALKRAETAAVLAQARHEAAHTRQRAVVEGTALIAAARDEGRRERDALLAQEYARIASERAAAETELRMHVAELASELASRVVGERITAPAEPRRGHGPSPLTTPGSQ
jgi:F-type H+-transporting ATPase subunit b